MNTRFAKTTLALALSALLLPCVHAAGEPAEGLKGGSDSSALQASQKNLVPVYFIGSHQDNLMLQNAGVNVLHNAIERQDKMAISHFDFKSNRLALDDDTASSRLLVVDGNYVANLRAETWEKVREYMRETAMAGNLVIAVGNLGIGMGLFPDHPDPSLPRDIKTGEVTARVFGVYWSPQGYGREFGSDDTDIVSAMTKATAWAKDVLDEQSQVRFFQNSEKHSSQNQLKSVSWTSTPDYQRNYTSKYCPYGEIQTKTMFKKLLSDGSSTWDWHQVHGMHILYPGKNSNVCSGSDWTNADAWTQIKVDQNISSGFLADWDPPTTSGTSSTTVTIGGNISNTGAGENASVSWTYAISDIAVHDNTYHNDAQWWHDINQEKAVGSSTVKLEPGVIARVPNGTTAIYNRFREKYEGQWWRCNRGPLGTCWHWYTSGSYGYYYN